MGANARIDQRFGSLAASSLAFRKDVWLGNRLEL